MASEIDPATLLDLDPDLLADLIAELPKRWTVRDEMTATMIDLLHAILRATTSAVAERRGDVPKPWRWPRPNQRRPKVSLGDLVRRMGR